MNERRDRTSARVARSPMGVLLRAAGAYWAATVLCGGMLYADNWPGWRGPDRTGVSAETGIPTRWSADQGVRWKVAVSGAGISSPIVWDEQLIVAGSDGPQQSELHVICLAIDDGRERWHRRFWGTAPTLHHATKSSMASPTPVTDGRRIYAFFGTGDVFCLEMDGRLVWHRSLATEYGRFENRFAASSSPLLYRDWLLLQCDHYGDSYVIAVDKETGADHWRVDRPQAWLSWSSPQLAPVPGRDEHELILCGSHKVDAFDPRTGKKLWTVGGMRRECIPTPVLGHGLVYAVSGPRGPTLAIRPGGRGDVTDTHVVWRNPRGAPFVPSGILVGDSYYLVDDKGIGTCLDAHTGKARWQHRLPGRYTASPVAGDGKIYFVNEEGSTVVIRSGASNYEEVARNRLDEPVYASPAIAQGMIFIRGTEHLYGIDGRKR